MQKTNHLFIENITEPISDFIFACNNLGFYVDSLEDDEDSDKFYCSVRFNWMPNNYSKYREKKEWGHQMKPDEERTDGRHSFDGTLPKILKDVKYFLKAPHSFDILDSYLLKK
jgi:hypothetical protein